MTGKVVFFYPSKNIGGAQILFARLGEYLSKNNFQLINVDFGSSFISDFLLCKKINFEHLIVSKSVSCKINIQDGCIFILPLSYLFLIDKYFLISKNVKFLFWDLHPHNLIDHTYFSYIYKNNYKKIMQKFFKNLEKGRLRRINNFLDEANLKKGLFFMCNRNYISNKEVFKIDFKPNYLPIPIPIPSNYFIQPQYKFSNEINIGWMSRLDQDKIPILNLLILDLDIYSSLNGSVKIILHIIGVGSASDLILKSRNIIIVMLGQVSGVKLSEYANKYLDLSFAMGTSALDFAAMKIPSVLVPSTTLYSEFKKINKKYIWLYKVQDFDVAAELYHEQTLDISSIIADFKVYGRKQLGDFSYDYVASNHSIDRVGVILMEKINSCELTYKDIKNTGLYNFTLIDIFLSTLKCLAKSIISKLS